MRERYGIKQRSKASIAAIVAALVVVVLAIVGLAFTMGTDRVQSRLLAWDIVSDDRVDVTFEVRPPDNRSVLCVVRAQDSTRTDVGYATVEIAGGNDYQLVTYPLHTLIPAYTVELLGCGIPGAFDVIGPQFPPGVVPPAQPWAGVTLDES
jgi:hypothetical protein